NGDVIVAINGTPVDSRAEVARELRGQAGQQVLLDLTRGKTSHRHIVEPVSIRTDTRLRYRDWLHTNVEKVQATGNGRIGYLHLYAMGSSDFAGFVREFYAQYDRDALIIDVRRNRGGNIDSWVIEKLLRRAWAFWQGSNGPPHTNMQQAFRGHLVVLADNFTYSDGETFTAAVKSLGLGPVIGQRTAGAGIWLSDRNRLRDGGLARIAETGQFDMAGHWIIEGHGVAPDIEIENKPHASATGGDAQLEAALDAPHNPTRRQADQKRSERLMATLDAINQKMGRGTVTFVKPSPGAAWHLRCAHRTPRWTTRWAELPCAKAR
ncbi:MAG TPA: S41 family peptidase, partial [Wenzhouxiangella sp.]|nr:S41 family peptidase [Wenzhouxiangella sp.]